MTKRLFGSPSGSGDSSLLTLHRVARLPKIWVDGAEVFDINLFKGSLNYGCKSHVVGVRAICVDEVLSKKTVDLYSV